LKMKNKEMMNIMKKRKLAKKKKTGTDVRLGKRGEYT
jgi:hypothetical protein